MQLGVHALVAGSDVQHTVALGAALNVHGLVGVEGTVDLQPLLLHGGAAALVLGFQNAEDVGTGDGVDRVIRQRHHRTGCGGVHLVGPGGLILPCIVALVNIVKHQTRCHGAVDGHTV